MKHGLLLINLGTPDAPTVSAVRRYLKQFLTDPRVVSLPALVRFCLFYTTIFPFRPRQSAQAYQTIWTDNGSPLLVNSLLLVEALQKKLPQNYVVTIGMRYGNPSLQQALDPLQNCETITILPLYPQFSSAATGSSLQEAMTLISQQTIQPNIRIIRDFYQHPSFIQAQAAIIKPFVNKNDYLLFSYHGLPKKHLQTAGCQQQCQETCPIIEDKNLHCYRAQCYQTSTAIAAALQLSPTHYTTAFQSKIGKTAWIAPYTNQILTKLRQEGIQNLVVCCPSFVSDCLETLEEIALRAKQQWLILGGKKFTIIPALNTNPLWVDALLSICSI